MPVKTKAITDVFRQVVRDHPTLRRWKKGGVRRIWDRSGEILRGLELVIFKHSFERDQVVGIAVHLGFPTPVQPIPNWIGGSNDGETFIVTTYLSPTEGMGNPTFASDRAWHLREMSDLEMFSANLPGLLGVAVEWLDAHSSNEAFYTWFRESHSMPIRLPMVLATEGECAAWLELASWLDGCPTDRPSNGLFEWLKTNRLLSEDLIDRIRRGSWQAEDHYCAEMRAIAAEIKALTAEPGTT